MKKFFFLIAWFSIALSISAQQLVDLELLLPAHFRPVTITCEKIDGNYFMQEDIRIDVSQILRTPFIKNAVATNSNSYLWENGIVPFKIENGHPRYYDIKQAIAHINTKTNVRLIERTNQNDYIYIGMKKQHSCFSFVGCIGGEQLVNIGRGCGYGTIIHEICHALGLWHEQSRADRDNYVIIKWENIENGKEHNFKKHLNNARVIGSYDYNSIMHYGKYSFSNSTEPTIVCRKVGCDIGQRKGLSSNDIIAINTLYPSKKVNPRPKPGPNKKKTEVSMTVSDVLYQEVGKGQWKEEVFLNINNKTYRMNLAIPFSPMNSISINLPEKGNYDYELTVYSYTYKCALFDCEYTSEPVVGRGEGKINP